MQSFICLGVGLKEDRPREAANKMRFLAAKLRDCSMCFPPLSLDVIVMGASFWIEIVRMVDFEMIEALFVQTAMCFPTV